MLQVRTARTPGGDADANGAACDPGREPRVLRIVRVAVPRLPAADTAEPSSAAAASGASRAFRVLRGVSARLMRVRRIPAYSRGSSAPLDEEPVVLRGSGERLRLLPRPGAIEGPLAFDALKPFAIRERPGDA